MKKGSYIITQCENEFKDNKEFWVNVNKFKNNQYNLSNNILIGEWVLYFKTKYIGMNGVA